MIRKYTPIGEVTINVGVGFLSTADARGRWTKSNNIQRGGGVPGTGDSSTTRRPLRLPPRVLTTRICSNSYACPDGACAPACQISPGCDTHVLPRAVMLGCGGGWRHSVWWHSKRWMSIGIYSPRQGQRSVRQGLMTADDAIIADLEMWCTPVDIGGPRGILRTPSTPLAH